MEVALYFARELKFPCEHPVTGENNRHLHLAAARFALENLRKKGSANPFAISFLESEIEQYSVR